MDAADRAAEYTELDQAIALQRRCEELPPTGRCYNCRDTVDSGAFCDPDCRDDYEKRKRMRGERM